MTMLTPLLTPLHPDPHPRGHAAATAALAEPTPEQLASIVGETMTVARGRHAGKLFVVKDWWDRVGDEPWATAARNEPPVYHGNRLAMDYAKRVSEDRLPDDDEVVYGNLEGTTPLGEPKSTPVLLHESEL